MGTLSVAKTMGNQVAPVGLVVVSGYRPLLKGGSGPLGSRGTSHVVLTLTISNFSPGVLAAAKRTHWAECCIWQAIDHLINSAAKTNYMSGGTINVPMVFRGPNGAAAGVAAQHSQVPSYISSWFQELPAKMIHYTFSSQPPPTLPLVTVIPSLQCAALFSFYGPYLKTTGLVFQAGYHSQTILYIISETCQST